MRISVLLVPAAVSLLGVRGELRAADAATTPPAPKRLNSEFGRVRILKAEGRWGRVRGGERVPVRMNVPIRAIVSVRNTGEARWTAPRNARGGKGSVYLEILGLPDAPRRQPLPNDVPSLGHIAFHDIIVTSNLSKPVDVQMRLICRGRGPFGKVFRVRLIPEPW